MVLSNVDKKYMLSLSKTRLISALYLSRNICLVICDPLYLLSCGFICFLFPLFLVDVKFFSNFPSMASCFLIAFQWNAGEIHSSDLTCLERTRNELSILTYVGYLRVSQQSRSNRKVKYSWPVQSIPISYYTSSKK